MDKEVEIIYREFYYVPRLNIIKYRDHVFLLKSFFDGEANKYTNHYTVFLLPDLSEDEINGSWESIHQMAIIQLGNIPIEKVNFDVTKNKSIDASILDEVEVKYGLWLKNKNNSKCISSLNTSEVYV